MKQLIWIALFAGACAHAKHTEGAAPSPAADQKAPAAQSTRIASAARPVGTSPKSIFEPGAIEKIQSRLNTRGYSIKENGQLDDATRDALIKFQRGEKLAATGMPDAETLRRLKVDPDSIMRKGSTTAR